MFFRCVQRHPVIAVAYSEFTQSSFSISFNGTYWLNVQFPEEVIDILISFVGTFKAIPDTRSSRDTLSFNTFPLSSSILKGPAPGADYVIFIFIALVLFAICLFYYVHDPINVAPGIATLAQTLKVCPDPTDIDSCWPKQLV